MLQTNRLEKLAQEAADTLRTALQESIPAIGGQTPSLRNEIQISTREQEIIDRVARGWGNAEIAKGLGISIKTVEAHILHVHGKLEKAGIDSFRTRAPFVRNIYRFDLMSNKPSIKLICAIHDWATNIRSPQAKEVFDLACEGLSIPEIASRRGVDSTVVDYHLAWLNKSLRENPRLMEFPEFKFHVWLTATLNAYVPEPWRKDGVMFEHLQLHDPLWLNPTELQNRLGPVRPEEETYIEQLSAMSAAQFSAAFEQIFKERSFSLGELWFEG